jgi:Zn-dependent protease with chaperone function/uncharacterized tellurite resistance protein B-like protein
MDFFESQDVARRNTKLLLVLFSLAVLSLILLTNLLIFAFVNFQDTASISMRRYYYSWELFASVSGGVVLVIIIASLFRMNTLKRGGSAIAEMLDGELLIDPGSDNNKRKLLNVVAEMAIASGTPVPPVYLIDEIGINAFAAGYSPGDAVIGVTRGAIENLSRDELQGVIAHEFSHILNGDMRINIRLMGVLYGILMMTIVGRIVLSPGHSRSRGKGHAGVVAIGAGLMIIGFLGQFFGNLIKAAVSRQREYLADASAVQFTRNPDGISGALKRIGGYDAGSVLNHPETEEMSHSLFSAGLSFSFANLMSTHPPLGERIKRIDKKWDGEFSEVTSVDPAPVPEAAMGFSSLANVALDADATVAKIGHPEASQLDIARHIIASLPDPLKDAALEPYSARALMYMMLLHNKPEIRDTQLDHLKESADFGVYAALQGLIKTSANMEPSMRIPLLEMALPTLRQLSYEQYKLFIGNLDVIVRADGRIGLSEWAIRKMITKHLGEAFEGQHNRPQHKNLKSVKGHCEVLLSMLAYADKNATVSPDDAFTVGQKSIELEIQLLKKSDLSFKKLNQALDTLTNLHPLRKPKLLKACIKTITADQMVSVVETELLRAIADTLDCPIPPIN